MKPLTAALDALARTCEDERSYTAAFDAVYKAAMGCAGGHCSHEYDYECGSDALLAFVAEMRKECAGPPVRCDACGDTGRTPWMSEADPNRYQEPDDDGMVPCVDCSPARTLDDHLADGLRCHGCGLSYGDPGWCDTYIPTDIWVQISPRGDESGVLCLTCMARALEARGISDVPLEVTSGPWFQPPGNPYEIAQGVSGAEARPMTPIEPCCFGCGTCGRVCCSDNVTDCGHDDTPTCPDCCLTSHADELLREALADWGKGEPMSGERSTR